MKETMNPAHLCAEFISKCPTKGHTFNLILVLLIFLNIHLQNQTKTNTTKSTVTNKGVSKITISLPFLNFSI